MRVCLSRHKSKPVPFITAVLVLTLITAAASAQTFSDVPPEHWAYDFIEVFADRGVTAGYGDGTFKSEEDCTVGERGKFSACSRSRPSAVVGNHTRGGCQYYAEYKKPNMEQQL